MSPFAHTSQTTGLASEPVASQMVSLVGIRPRHFASHSGYEGFSRYIGTILKPPVNFRRGSGSLARLINTVVTSVTHHPGYSLGAFLTEAAAALHMLRRRHVIYHLLYGDTGLWMLGRVSRMVGGCLVATFHRPPSVLIRYGIDRRRIQDLAAAILVSDSQRSHFEGLLPPNRIFVVSHGVDTDFFRPPEEMGDEQVCITVGAYLRDFETLALAIHRIWQVKPTMRFVAVGTAHPQDAHFKYLKDKRLDILAGVPDEELRLAYQRSRVAIFSLQDSTANNSLLEAMASGLPIVATDVGGVRQYLGDKAGILCPARDSEALANGVLQLLDDPSRRARMGVAGRARALGYDYRVVADRMREVYSEILSMRAIRS